MARNRRGLASIFFHSDLMTTQVVEIVLSKAQRDIFKKVKAFVMEKRVGSLASRTAKLSLPNVFPAKDRTFITKLSADLHLSVAWDEYDDEDQNLVTWRFPGAFDDDDDEVVEGESADESGWEDAEDDEEAIAAVDRVLKKYEKANVTDSDDEGSFDERHERMVKERMDRWKRDYYRVGNIRGWKRKS